MTGTIDSLAAGGIAMPISRKLFGEGLRVEQCPVVPWRVQRVEITEHDCSTILWNVHNFDPDLNTCFIAGDFNFSSAAMLCFRPGDQATQLHLVSDPAL